LDEILPGQRVEKERRVTSGVGVRNYLGGWDGGLKHGQPRVEKRWERNETRLEVFCPGAGWGGGRKQFEITGDRLRQNKRKRCKLTVGGLACLWVEKIVEEKYYFLSSIGGFGTGVKSGSECQGCGER